MRDQPVNVARKLRSVSERAHRRESSGCQSVVLGAGFDQLVLDEPLVDRQGGDRVDLLVRLHQLAPGLVAVQRQRVREVPREPGILQGEQSEQDRVPRDAGQLRDRERCEEAV